MFEPLPYLFRAIHILSAVLLAGGIFYAWNLSKSAESNPNPARGFQPSVIVLVLLLFLSGAYTLMQRMPVPKEYHMIFGLKFLLFLHIAAVSLLVVKPGTPAEKRPRMLTGLAISATAVILLASALRAVAP